MPCRGVFNANHWRARDELSGALNLQELPDPLIKRLKRKCNHPVSSGKVVSGVSHLAMAAGQVDCLRCGAKQNASGYSPEAVEGVSSVPALAGRL